LFNVIVAIHVLAVIASFAVLFAYPVLVRRAAPGERAGLHRRMERLFQRVLNPGLVVVLLAGLYLAHHDKDFAAFYVDWGLVAILVIGAVAGSLLIPGERRLAALAADGGTEYDAVGARQLRFVLGLCALVVLTIVFMALQLGS
jgi:uncharacterized membrane protein